jgi:hypothetical protein
MIARDNPAEAGREAFEAATIAEQFARARYARGSAVVRAAADPWADDQTVCRLDGVVRCRVRAGVAVVHRGAPSGSGKAFVASPLSAVTGAPIVEIDDFVSAECFAGWWPRFDAWVLTPREVIAAPRHDGTMALLARVL